MSEFLRATGILFRAHLARMFRTRRGYIAIGLAAIPVGLALLVQQVLLMKGRDAPPEGLTSLLWLVLVQAIVPLVALVGASAVIAEEIEDRTITYLFTRPIPRPAILVGRWSAAALPIALLLALAGWLAAGFLLATPGENAREWAVAGMRWRLAATACLGGLVYTAVFAAAGALFKRPMLVGIAYVFVYEGFLGNLPGSTQKSTVSFYLKSFLFEPSPDLMGEMQEALAVTTLAVPSAAVGALLLILVGALALGSWRFARREYVLAA